MVTYFLSEHLESLRKMCYNNIINLCIGDN